MNQSQETDVIKNQGITILKNYDESLYQDVINYYYHELVTNPGDDNSFISSVLPEMLNDNFVFRNTSLFGISAEDYITSLSKKENKSNSEAKVSNDDVALKVYSSSREYIDGGLLPNQTPRQPGSGSPERICWSAHRRSRYGYP